MRDIGLDILMMVVFGIGGITILVLAWIQPMSPAERILSISVGSAGLLGVLIRIVLLMSVRAGVNAGEKSDRS